MSEKKEHWITTISKSYRYYRVRARTKREAVQRYKDGLAECVASKESAEQRVIKVLGVEPPLRRR